MTKSYEFSIPNSLSGNRILNLQTGQSLVIIGANGSGKTRLGVHLEGQIPPMCVQRIAAQKSLALNDRLNIISLERASQHLRVGYPEVDQGNKETNRWGHKPATHFLSDFDALQQTLFAEHNRVASKHLDERAIDLDIPIPRTKLQELKTIWDELLPHRKLQVLEAAIRVSPIADASSPIYPGPTYPGSEMSDGERAIFYFLGQCLVAPRYGVVIVDEPESHVHRAIVGPLWDAIEGARPDCCFVYITHDLAFAAERKGCARYFTRSYNHDHQWWDIEEFPKNSGLPEQVITQLVGSRRPILFVEGELNSLDLMIYRSHYVAFTIISVGSCSSVIHSVASYQGSANINWVGAHGLVDGDDRESTEVEYLNAQNVYVLPVKEVENLLLLPSVFVELAKGMLCDDPASLLAKLKAKVFADAAKDLQKASCQYTIRQLDYRLKRVSMKATDLLTLQVAFQEHVEKIDPVVIFNAFKAKLEKNIAAGDLTAVLSIHYNNGWVPFIASVLGLKNKEQLTEKLKHLLTEKTSGQSLREAIAAALPKIPL